VLQLCSIVLILFLIVLAPILRYEGVVFGAAPLTFIVNYGVKMVSITWIAIVLNCAAILFDRARLLPEIEASSYNM